MHSKLRSPLLSALPLLLAPLTACVILPANYDDDGPDEHEPEWGYDGEIGPSHWGDLDDAWATCGDGTEQSPIDIVPDDIVEGPGLPPTLSWGTTSLFAYNPGYYLRYEVDPGSTMVIGAETFHLLQFHFHALSEHTVEGEHSAIEIHFVHASQDDATRLAVLALFVSSDAEDGVAGVFDDGGSLHFRDAIALPESHQPTDLDGDVDLGATFSSLALESAVHYSGSLTTPPCTEGVEFFVLPQALYMLPADAAAFEALFDHNYRPVQPLNGRVVSSFGMLE